MDDRWMSMSPRRWFSDVFSVAVLVGLLQQCVKVQGDTRCYCNDVSCVTTGYLCKSTIGICFSQLTHDGAAVRSHHACVEMLPVKDRNACATPDDVTNTGSANPSWAGYTCCSTDMCNYKDNFGLNIYINRRPANTTPAVEDRADVIVVYTMSQRQLWFRAAVIAVPLVGALILIVLVIIAVRMLARDATRRRHCVRTMTSPINDKIYTSTDDRRPLNASDNFFVDGFKMAHASSRSVPKYFGDAERTRHVPGQCAVCCCRYNCAANSIAPDGCKLCRSFGCECSISDVSKTNNQCAQCCMSNGDLTSHRQLIGQCGHTTPLVGLAESSIIYTLNETQ